MKTVPPTRRFIRSTIGRWTAVLALAAGCHQGTPPRPRSGDSPGTASADAAPVALAPDSAADLAVDGAADARDAGRDLAPPDGAATNDTGPAPTDTGILLPPDAAPIVPAPGCGSTLVYSGQEAVVDAFPTGPGILIVRASGVLLVDRTGQVLRELKMPREVTGAAYDGTRLVIADRGMLTELRPTLERVASKPLRETCSVMAILGDGRVVCSGSTYVFTYRMDATTPGRPIDFARPRLRVVPGTSDVIEGVALARYPDTGFALRAYGDQNAKLWAPYAFKGSPVTHVVATDGALLKIAGCTLSYPGASNCFTPDGNLGTLRAQEGYVGLVEDSPTSALALVRKMPVPYPPFDERACAAGCFAQRIDLNSRTVLSEKPHTLDGFVWKSMRPDTQCRKLMVLSRTVAEPRGNDDPEILGDYRVQLLDYGATGGAPVYPPGGFLPLPPEPEPTFTTPGPACALPRTLARSTERIQDIHPTADGVIVVRDSGLTLVDRQGVTKAEAKRPVLATAFDGARLLASDQKTVTIYTPALVQSGQLTVAEPCGGLTFLDGDRFLCGGDRDADRIFYTYDLKTKAELARSAPYYYRGLPITRIPGLSSFLTITENSPRYTLFDLDDAGKATLVNQGADLHDHFASQLFGFLGGKTSTHIVDQSSRILRIRDLECGVMQNTGHFQQCFEADGVLGNLRYGERMVGVASDGDANVYGLVSPRPTSVFDEPCDHGCTVQRIDVATRRVVSRRPVANLMLRYGLKTRVDTACGMLVLLYREPPASIYDSFGSFAVDLLDYRSPAGGP